MQVASELKEVNIRLNRLEASGLLISMVHNKYDGPKPHPKNGLPVIGHTLMTAHRESKSGECTKFVGVGISYCSDKDVFKKSRGATVAFDHMVNFMSRKFGRAWVKEIIEKPTQAELDIKNS